MEHLTPVASANGHAPQHSAETSRTAIRAGLAQAGERRETPVSPPLPRPVPESSVQEYGLLDQLHSLYADKARLEVTIGMSDADDVIRHVMDLRREQNAARSDLHTAMDILQNVLKRLDATS
jgi:hypothetical protein